MVEAEPLVNTLRSELAAVSASRYWLAFSGGLDSRVLLDLLLRCREYDDNFPPVHVVHVNHQLQSEALQWAAQVESLCATLNIPCEIATVTVGSAGVGIEAAARAARYRVFESLLVEGDVLLMGHHGDDQAETVLMRLLRGAGVDGLAAIPQTRPLGRGCLLRPLLHTPRTELVRYAQAHRLDHVHDPSNDDNRYDRNFLRNRIVPVLRERWHDVGDRLVRTARQQREAALLLNEYLDADLARISDADSLDLTALCGLPEGRRRPLLKRYLQGVGLSLEERQLADFYRQFVLSADDAEPRWPFEEQEFYRYRGRLHHDRLREPIAGRCAKSSDGECWAWMPGEVLELPGGRLTASPGGRFAPSGRLQIRLRQGGERCTLAGDSHSRSLKKLLQEWGVPPHRRGELPLIYSGGVLAAIADLAICEGYVAVGGEEGWQLRWTPKR